MNTVQQLRFALSIQREREISSEPSLRIPTRRRVKQERKSFRALARKEQPESMLNMGKPPGHRTLPRFPSERERVMFFRHQSRQDAGWIRG